MNIPYKEYETFSGVDFSEARWSQGEYERCCFERCNFSSADLSDSLFTECCFEGCDLSLARLKNTTFQNVQFRQCKLMGLRFEDCNKFSLSLQFADCILNFASFYKLKMREVCFENCKLVEADFTETDLTGASFPDCDLSGATFDRTILEQADLRGAACYTINPEINRIKRARFAINGVSGLLQQYEIEIDY